jgi:hypothetical protein
LGAVSFEKGLGNRPALLKSSNLDNFEHIHNYLNSSRFWPTVVKRATNNQAYQSNAACGKGRIGGAIGEGQLAEGQGNWWEGQLVRPDWGNW